MKRWKWILATTALLMAISGGAMAEEQHGRDRRDNDDGYYSQGYQYRRNDNGYYRGQYGYQDRDGDRDDRGNWRQRRNSDYNQNYNRAYNHRDRDRDRDRD